MLKYHLFVMDGYYPTGFDDYVESFETLEQARFSAMSPVHASRDWFEIAETQDDGSLASVDAGRIGN